MALQATLRINMTGLAADPALEAERYRAAIEMAVHAEEQGFQTVNPPEPPPPRDSKSYGRIHY